MAKTLLHEIGHAIYSFYDLGESPSEERVVSVYATALCQIAVDNPALFSLIREAMRGPRVQKLG